MRKNKIIFVICTFLCIFSLLPALNSFAEDAINTLKINSINFENKPVYGFVYEIKEKATMNTVARADMRKTSEWQTQLKDGEYVIVETERPEGYDKAKDVNITLPYKNDQYGLSRRISFTPKHVLAVDKPKTPPDSDIPPHVRTGDYINFMFYLGILLIGAGLAGLFRNEESGERLKN